MFAGTVFILWVFGLVITGLLIFAMVFLLVSLIDLENGYLQPVDVCHRANQLILPEVACHAVVTTVLLVTGYWIEGLYNVPMAVYHAKAYSSRSIHLDPTTVFDSISYRKMFATAKLLFYLLFFFVCIFRVVDTLIKGIFHGQGLSDFY